MAMIGDPGVMIRQLQGSPRRRRKESLIRGILVVAAGDLPARESRDRPRLARSGGELPHADRPRRNSGPPGGSRATVSSTSSTILIGTVEVSVIAMLIAAPLGLGAAMYLSEYATPNTRRRLKPIIETLAGIPSVVLGYFALQVINPAIVQNLFPAAGTFTIMAAGIGVGILTIPLVASVAEDAMHAVPGSLREAAYGIGARRRTVTTKVVFPAAVSGIMASLILGFSRALGETMVVAIAAGASGGAPRHWNPLDAGQTMTGAISSLADRLGPREERDRAEPLRFPLLRRFAVVRDDLGAQPRCRSGSSAGSGRDS